MRRIREYAVDAATNRLVLWAAFIIVHLYLGLVNLYSPSNPMGDVRFVYSGWVQEGLQAQYWVGIDVAWVYPIVAMVPILAAELFGHALYPATWLSMVLVLDAVALATLTGWGRRARNISSGWYWTLFLFLVGPIAMGRIDAISVAVALIGVVILAAHPIAGSVLIALATWIKVWPAAIVAALIIASRERKAVFASAIATSIGVVFIALAFGSGDRVASFITEQTGRGLQVEAPVSTVWMWFALAGSNGAAVYYDADLLTFQVMGNGVDTAAAIMNPVMVIAAAVVAILGIRATRRGADATALLSPLMLGFITCMIVFNKVGSPQYVTWLVVPVLLAIVSAGGLRQAFATPAALVLVIAVLTQLIYPFFYNDLLLLNPAMVAILTIRNLLLVFLFGWSLAAIARLQPLAGVVPELPRPLAISTER
jgi:hypothetical protein